MKRVGKGDDAKPEGRARGLESIAKELEDVVAKVPPRVAADAGATPELMQRLRAYSKSVLDARSRTQAARGSRSSRYDVMNVLDGRMMLELRALEGAMRDARKANKSIPALRIGILHPTKKRKKAKAPTEAAKPAPAEAAKPVPAATKPTPAVG
ncbi:MAG: hypothetical protein IT372_28895 [Polyangiaceae bacterium]|nr:hypothetical protein [Polyangiaceae bacterium]